MSSIRYRIYNESDQDIPYDLSNEYRNLNDLLSYETQMVSGDVLFAHFLINEFGSDSSELDEALRISRDEDEPFSRKNVEAKVSTSSYETFVEPMCTSCSICQSDFEKKNMVSKLECSHIFHTECISEWVRYKSECPNCKANVDVGENDT